MRILVVTPWYPTTDAPESGVFVEREAVALATEHDVKVLHLDWNGRAGQPVDGPGVEARRLSLRRSRPIDYLRARRAVRGAARQSDIVHTHALPGLIPWVLGRPARLPWVHSEHWSTLTSPETRGTAERMMLRLLAPLLTRPDVVVAESSRLAAAIQCIRTGSVELVPCVVPSVDVRPRPKELRLIGIGTMTARKDPLTAVETAAHLRQRGHDASLTWIGDGPLREHVAFLARRLGVADHVVLTGSLPPAEVSEQLAEASVLLLPTRGDNFCVVAAEALVHGRPIVSGAATGAVDYAPPAASRFVSQRDPRAYADAVESVIASTANLSAPDVAALVAGRFDPETVASGLSAIYRRLVPDDHPQVDVIIPVHDPRRPVARAVRSVLLGTRSAVRVTVVVHNTDPAAIRASLEEFAHDDRLRIQVLNDGIPSPAGPFNAGLDLAHAPFTAVMGSDDTLECGAIDSWLRAARRDHADVVIARLRRSADGAVLTPPTRIGRTRGLDGVRDRLSYRSAPLGLISTATFHDLRFAAGRVVGEDVPYVTRLWFSGASITYDRNGPAYVVHDDAEERTTLMPRPIRDELRYLHDVLDDPWFQKLPVEGRASFCVKALRTHIFGAVHNRNALTDWPPAEREALAEMAYALVNEGEGIERVLSRRDRSLLDAALDPAVPNERLLVAARRRRNFAAPSALIPRRFRDVLHREAPARLALASALQSW